MERLLLASFKSEISFTLLPLGHIQASEV